MRELWIIVSGAVQALGDGVAAVVVVLVAIVVSGGLPKGIAGLDEFLDLHGRWVAVVLFAGCASLSAVLRISGGLLALTVERRVLRRVIPMLDNVART